MKDLSEMIDHLSYQISQLKMLMGYHEMQIRHLEEEIHRLEDAEIHHYQAMREGSHG